MSGALDVLQMKEEFVLKVLAAGTQLGSTNPDVQVEQHIYRRETDGTCTRNLKGVWEKLLLAARAIVAVENPAPVSVTSSGDTGPRAVPKFAAAAGATPTASRFTPGAFTNQVQAAFREPHDIWRLPTPGLTASLSPTCPMLTIALCHTDCPPRHRDVAVPCNNQGGSLSGSDVGAGLGVLRMRSTVSCEHPWEVLPDLYLCRDPEETEKEEQAAAERAVTEETFQGECTVQLPGSPRSA